MGYPESGGYVSTARFFIRFQVETACALMCASLALMAALVSWEQGRRGAAEDALGACLEADDTAAAECALETAGLRACSSLYVQAPVVVGGVVFFPNARGDWMWSVMCSDGGYSR